MYSLLKRTADRMVEVAVPKINAGACCPPDPYYKFCYCDTWHMYIRMCQTDCACQDHCGGCYWGESCL